MLCATIWSARNTQRTRYSLRTGLYHQRRRHHLCRKRRQGIINDHQIIEHISLIEGRLQEIFRQAREKDLQPEVVADLYAEEKLKEKINW
jgi:predicted transcriptional regulator